MANQSSQQTGSTASNIGHAVADAAKNVGHKIAEAAGAAVEFVKDKAAHMGHSDKSCASKIHERMEVVGSCGTKVGVVDHVEGEAIKLTRNDSRDGQHHYIPVSWVDHVDSHVHLKQNSMQAEAGWKADAASCACSG